jgi:hypothetical protein
MIDSCNLSTLFMNQFQMCLQLDVASAPACAAKPALAQALCIDAEADLAAAHRTAPQALQNLTEGDIAELASMRHPPQGICTLHQWRLSTC